jgi:hypothetical protein
MVRDLRRAKNEQRRKVVKKRARPDVPRTGGMMRAHAITYNGLQNRVIRQKALSRWQSFGSSTGGRTHSAVGRGVSCSRSWPRRTCSLRKRGWMSSPQKTPHRPGTTTARESNKDTETYSCNGIPGSRDPTEIHCNYTVEDGWRSGVEEDQSKADVPKQKTHTHTHASRTAKMVYGTTRKETY